MVVIFSTYLNSSLRILSTTRSLIFSVKLKYHTPTKPLGHINKFARRLGALVVSEKFHLANAPAEVQGVAVGHAEPRAAP